MSPARPEFRDQTEYGRQFTDPVFWRPYLEWACQKSQLEPPSIAEPGFAGTCPVFRIGLDRFVKLFPDWFGGEEGYAAEWGTYRVLQNEPDFPAPRLLASGSLWDEGDEWHWPYLVISTLPGRSLGEERDALTHDDLDRAARYCGRVLGRFHRLTVSSANPLLTRRESVQSFLNRQRSGCRDRLERAEALSSHLLDQVDGFLDRFFALPPLDPLLLHADLNHDHLLGQFSAGGWKPTGIIDFGDARVGDPFYELPALHLGLFLGDRQLLGEFLAAYEGGLGSTGNFVLRAMAMTLLHEFDVLAEYLDRRPELRRTDTLEELGTRIWQSD